MANPFSFWYGRPTYNTYLHWSVSFNFKNQSFATITTTTTEKKYLKKTQTNATTKHTLVFRHKMYAQAAHIFKNMHTLGVTKTHYRRKRSCYFQELFVHVTATAGWLWGALPCLLTLPTLFGCDWCAGSTVALLRQWLIPRKVEKVQVGRKQVGSWMKGDKYNLHVYQKGLSLLLQLAGGTLDEDRWMTNTVYM